MKIRSLLPISMALVVWGLVLPFSSNTRACSIFCDSGDGVVLAGRNWDMVNDGQPTVMWFVPASDDAYGHVCFGRHGDCEDGMNDRGLFVAIAATPPNGKFMSTQKAKDCPEALEELLMKCADVEEGIAWLKRNTNIVINGSIWSKGNRFGNSGIGGHYLLADKSGKSVVCEWNKGQPVFIRKSGRHQLITNFLLTKPEGEDKSCPRFRAMTGVLNSAAAPSLENAARALQSASHTLTRYSQVYDLTKGEVHAWFNHNFSSEKKFRLGDELQKGAREVSLKEFFGAEPNYVSRPKVTGNAPVTGEHILSKALQARGGVDSARSIQSYHARGKMKLDTGWTDWWPIETFAIRPNKIRYMCEIKSSETNTLRIKEGYDGKTGWLESGGSVTKLKGEQLENQRAAAEFFAYYDDPARYVSAQCVGEVSFGGKPCYAVKLATKARREEIHYYDKDTFLLMGGIREIISDGEKGLEITRYGEYRDFGGFKFPTSIGWQSDEDGGTIQYSAIEVNSVEGSAVKKP